MNELGLQDTVKPLVMTSVDAVNIIKNNIYYCHIHLFYSSVRDADGVT